MPWHKDWLDIAQAVAVILTLIALVIYTYKTAGLLKQARKQNDLSLRPCLTISEGSLYCKNIGHGPAFNIHILEEPSSIIKNKYEIMGLIEVGESKEVMATFFTMAGEVEAQSRNTLYAHPLN